MFLKIDKLKLIYRIMFRRMFLKIVVENIPRNGWF